MPPKTPQPNEKIAGCKVRVEYISKLKSNETFVSGRFHCGPLAPYMLS